MQKSLKIGAVAICILTLGSGGAGIALAWIDPNWISLAALGTIGAGLATVVTRREELNQNERNAQRYECAKTALSHIRGRHTQVHQALAQGKAQVLPKYVAAVHQQLSLEHRQWLTDTRAMEATLQDLSESATAQESLQAAESLSSN